MKLFLQGLQGYSVMTGCLRIPWSFRWYPLGVLGVVFVFFVDFRWNKPQSEEVEGSSLSPRGVYREVPLGILIMSVSWNFFSRNFWDILWWQDVLESSPLSNEVTPRSSGSILDFSMISTFGGKNRKVALGGFTYRFSHYRLSAYRQFLHMNPSNDGKFTSMILTSKLNISKNKLLVWVINYWCFSIWVKVNSRLLPGISSWSQSVEHVTELPKASIRLILRSSVGG